MPAYRIDCGCRKPRPGLLLRASEELGVDLRRSFMVGDRITDVMAGAAAGCRTILVQTGQHLAPQIQTTEPLEVSVRSDLVCADLHEAAR